MKHLSVKLVMKSRSLSCEILQSLNSAYRGCLSECKSVIVPRSHHLLATSSSNFLHAQVVIKNLAADLLDPAALEASFDSEGNTSAKHTGRLPPAAFPRKTSRCTYLKIETLPLIFFFVRSYNENLRKSIYYL